MADFGRTLEARGIPPLAHRETTTLQVNVGLTCNQACHHCHVDSSPKRAETMPREVWERLLLLLERSPEVGLVDVTGGAPELHRAMRELVVGARRLGRRAMVRSNLTVLETPEGEGFPEFFVEHGVELTCSLPCYLQENVDRQRGRGVFDGSVQALRRLNALGYGKGGGLVLNLVYNPVGPKLPPEQAGLEAAYKEQLLERFGIAFDRLICITNMPIARFREDLRRQGALRDYERLLVDSFNPDTVPDLMCLDQVSVDWDGTLYDCDFHLATRLPMEAGRGLPMADGARRARTVFDLEALSDVAGDLVRTAGYCFGCTAGAGSSCGGALVGAPAGSSAG